MVNKGRTPYLTKAQQWRVAHGLDPGIRTMRRSDNNPLAEPKKPEQKPKLERYPSKEDYHLITSSKDKHEIDDVKKSIKEEYDVKTLVTKRDGIYQLHVYPVYGNGANAYLPEKTKR
jgi:hypothetical protein